MRGRNRADDDGGHAAHDDAAHEDGRDSGRQRDRGRGRDGAGLDIDGAGPSVSREPEILHRLGNPPTTTAFSERK